MVGAERLRLAFEKFDELVSDDDPLLLGVDDPTQRREELVRRAKHSMVHLEILEGPRHAYVATLGQGPGSTARGGAWIANCRLRDSVDRVPVVPVGAE